MSHASAVASASSLAVNGGAPVSEKPIPMISVDITDADVEAAVRTLRTGMLAQGANVGAFETRFAELTGSRHAIACANGTCALQLAYELLFEAGDEVLCPTWTYIATASRIAARGATPVFCDADPATYNIDVEDAAKRITPKTTAIAVTHLYGNPANIDAVQKLASAHNLSVIYDAAQAHLATYRGEGLGAYGDAVTYSFYPTKNMTTGEGGMVTVNSDELDHDVRLLRSHGETQKYTHERVGYNYRMTDVEAAIGLSQLDRIESVTARRRTNAAELNSLVSAIPGLHPPSVTDSAEHAYHLYVVRMDLDAFLCDRDAFLDALRAEGVQCAVHYPRPVHRQPVFSHLGAASFPVADQLAKSLFCVPVHPGIGKDDVARVGEALSKVAGAYAR